MEKMYAPWRYEYVKRDCNCDCVFCDISQNSINDKENQILYRDKYCFIVMNVYPYSPGHFMIIPHHHTDKLEDLDPHIWSHMSLLAQRGVKMLKDVLGAKGVNIGMNIGKDAGAGIAEHIHLHILPRWNGDTNFITTIGGARVYSVDFEKIYVKLLKASKDYFDINI